jgi:hypothetical protein
MVRRGTIREQDKHYIKCDLCPAMVWHGPHRYDGHWSPSWQMFFCATCWGASWDGFASWHDAAIIAHLRAKGLPPPKRNSDGLIARPVG